MKVRAKFWCSGSTPQYEGEDGQMLTDYHFTAVADGSPENEAFWEATPAGSLTMAVVKPGLFEAGKYYYLDFTEAPQ